MHISTLNGGWVWVEDSTKGVTKKKSNCGRWEDAGMVNKAIQTETLG